MARRAALPTLLLVGLLTFAVADPPPAPPRSASRLLDTETIRKRLGLLPEYAAVSGVEKVRIAVLDHGFDGVDGKKPYLPASTVIVEHYDDAFVRRFALGDPAFRKPFTPLNYHGRTMAQIVWAMTGSDPRGPQFYLLNANGPTLFRRAVRYAIEQKVDLVLFSGHFEGAGNYDGRGPINRAVDEAAAAGILWINAAGNAGGRVYNGRVVVGADGWLSFRTGSDPTALRVRNRLDENALTILLTWNDYRDEEDAGTDKDLDLYVEDAEGRVLASSTLRQVPGDRKAAAGETRNPRERLVVTDLPAAPERDYRIRIRRHAGTFSETDRLRVQVTGSRSGTIPDPKTSKPVEALHFLDASGWGEVYPPADHRGVITVGTPSRGSSVGPTSDDRAKPDLFLEDSRARFSNGEESAGSSNAAAFFTGIVAMLKAAEPGLRTAHLLALSRHPAALNEPRTRTLPPQANTTVRTPSPVRITSYNEARALRHAEAALQSREARGQPAGGVWVTISRPDGSVVRMPAEEALRRQREAARPLYPAYGETPAATRSPVPPATVRAAAEDEDRQVYTWRTPARRYLADLVRPQR